MLRVGIDQFTLVIKPDFEFEYEDWEDIALMLIEDLISKADFENIFSEMQAMLSKLPEGYTRGFTCPMEPFYFAIAYHEAFPKMGVICKFSGNAWQIYQKSYEEIHGEEIIISSFLRMIKSPLYEIRLSRVDPYVDFIDEGISVSQIQKSLSAGRLVLCYGKHK